MKKWKVATGILIILIASYIYYIRISITSLAPVIAEPMSNKVEEVSQFEEESNEQFLSKEEAKKEKENLNVVLLGRDSDSSEPARSDSIMLVTVNLDTKKAAIISIPRDTRVKLSEVGLTKINHASMLSGSNIKEGTIKTVQSVSNLLGVPVNYYLVLNFQGFTKMVDSLGGIEVNLPQAVNDDYRDIHLSVGKHLLNGDEALRLARARYGLARGDFDRQQNNYYLLSALSEKVFSLSSVTKYPEIIKTLYEDFLETNLSISQITALGLEYRNISKENVKYFQLPGQGIMATDPLVQGIVYYYEPDLPGIAKIMNEVSKYLRPDLLITDKQFQIE